ncbi:MAG: hypothetical protein IPL58_12890 [Betaproteobacteria bacterium]|uniref:Uncharacterized protein n=1 Tax=Candidatus Proximibacter danicus TaxID=2954365 RepID=A0A9D7PR53_9PROT|nr:hypothetical protein [Candidatus Proximibacter danicus]
MSFFLPARPSAEQQVLIDQLKEGAVSRLLMLAVEGGDATQRAAASRELRQRLADHSEFVSRRTARPASPPNDLLFRHRYVLSPRTPQNASRSTACSGSIGDSIDLLASPAGHAGQTFPDLLTRPVGRTAQPPAGQQPAE